MINSVKGLANIKRRNINGAAHVCKILNSRFQCKYRIHGANLFFEAKLNLASKKRLALWMRYLNCKESVFNASPQIANKTISNDLDMTGDRVIPR